MIYDFRQRSCNVHLWIANGKRVWDADTGEEVHRVFYLDTDTGEVGRYEFDAASGRHVMDVSPDGGYGPKQIWERRNVRVEYKDGTESVHQAGPPPGQPCFRFTDGLGAARASSAFAP